MKLPSATIIILLGLSALTVSQVCDTNCRLECVKGKKGDECISSCGCATLNDEMMTQFT